MLPSPETRWFRSVTVAVLLAAGIPALLVVPARHAVTEVWPERVEEIILFDGSRQFSPPAELEPGPEVLARSYPISLVTLELDDGEVIHGFVLPSGDAEDEQAVLVSNGTETRGIDASAIRRTFRPNAMSVRERWQLMTERIRELRREKAPTRASSDPSGEPAPGSVEGDDI